MRLAVPAVDQNSRAGTLTELGSQKGDDREQPEQAGRGAGYRAIRPLPLGLDTQMSASLLEGDLDLPAQDEPTDDLQGIPRGIGAQQRLG